MSAPTLDDELASRGFAIVPLAEAWSTTPEGLREAAGSPFAFAQRLLGVAPLLVERQPIRPIDGGRSFASTRIDTPLHTDSQMFLGVPAAVQILVCVTAAPRGGESVLLDADRMLARLERETPALARALVDVPRTQRFYFGDVVGPTVARRGGHVTWTVAPGQLGAKDEIGAALAREAACEPTIHHALRRGEALVASNHRMLHGRAPFEGERELVRLLVWLERPLARAPSSSLLADARELAPPPSASAYARLRAVLAILRGVPPAKAAQDAGVDEPTLYGWRDALMTRGLAGLEAPT